MHKIRGHKFNCLIWRWRIAWQIRSPPLYRHTILYRIRRNGKNEKERERETAQKVGHTHFFERAPSCVCPAHPLLSSLQTNILKCLDDWTHCVRGSLFYFLNLEEGILWVGKRRAAATTRRWRLTEHPLMTYNPLLPLFSLSIPFDVLFPLFYLCCYQLELRELRGYVCNRLTHDDDTCAVGKERHPSSSHRHKTKQQNPSNRCASETLGDYQMKV